MALHQDTIWEVRTGGNNENGGGFHNRVPGTSVDYTFQNAPQLDLTDIACAGAGVITITSVAGGFTAEMVGNLIRFHAGANFIVGFYEIVAINSPNSIDLDRTPVTGVGSNGHGKVGGGQINCDLIDTVALPGNIVYIASGTYAGHPSTTFTAVSTQTLPLIIEGYDGLRGTSPTGNNRPLLQMGAGFVDIINFVKISNIRFEGTGDPIIKWTAGLFRVFIFKNCKFSNLANAGSASCLRSTVPPNNRDEVIFIDCEFLGAPGATSIGVKGWTAGGANFIVFNCYFHNLTTGIDLGFGGGLSHVTALFSIFAVCSYGILAYNTGGTRVINCTFDAISIDGVNGGGSYSIFMNNSFTNCVNAGISSSYIILKNNNFFGCPAIAVDPLDNNTFIAPQFVTPGSNYALQRTSGLIDRAFSMRLGV